ncbi:vitamin B6 photo-protection and homoeostasis-domain-containing protein [Chytridium lagenaria]|nr:vitamin B6 photo-protection and homoeostasis-domain-containing protein [Chytridium lagenaria]
MYPPHVYQLPTLSNIPSPHRIPQSPDRIYPLHETIHGRKRIYIHPSITTSTDKPYIWEDEIRGTLIKRGWGRWLPNVIVMWLRTTFLPVGYPDTVHRVYAKVHWLQGVESFVWSTPCSNPSNMSAASATGTAVAIQWVLKDGLGEIGKLFLIQRFAGSFDSHPKTWKIIGEVASVCGALMQLGTVLVGGEWFLVMASVGFSIYNATHMTFTHNFALHGNVGDLRRQRRQPNDRRPSPRNLPWGVDEMEKWTSGFGEWVGKGVDVPKVKMGVNLEECFRDTDEMWRVVEVMEIIAKSNNSFPQSSKCENYLIGVHFSSSPSSPLSHIHLTYHQSATHIDIIRSLLHVSRLRHQLRPYLRTLTPDTFTQELKTSGDWTRRYFDGLCKNLNEMGWRTDAVFWEDRGRRAVWGGREVRIQRGCREGV